MDKFFFLSMPIGHGGLVSIAVILGDQFENGAKVNSNFFRMRIRRGFILSMKGIISMVNTELTSTSLEDGSRYLVRTRSPAIHNSQSSPRLL